MSSWIVDKAVIDLLVEAVFRYEIPLAQDVTPDALGAMLWKANYKGVNWRYNKRRRPPAYAHAAGRVLVDDGMGHPLKPIKTLVRDGLMVFMQSRCYQYQSCDHPAWDASTARFLVDALETAILKGLGMTIEDAWDAIDHTIPRHPWGIYYHHPVTEAAS